jgi:hypothetical protein
MGDARIRVVRGNARVTEYFARTGPSLSGAEGRLSAGQHAEHSRLHHPNYASPFRWDRSVARHRVNVQRRARGCSSSKSPALRCLKIEN